MTSFELGFMKYAQECGLSSNQAAHILQRTLDHPGSHEMFSKSAEETNYTSDDLDVLSGLVAHAELDEEMSRYRSTLSI